MIAYFPQDGQSIAAAIRGGGKSGLHGTAYRLMTGRGDPTIRATETNRLSSSETGNLYAQQLQIGSVTSPRFKERVEGLTYCGNTVCRLIMLATLAWL